MAEDLDIEALLDAAYDKKNESTSSKESSKKSHRKDKKRKRSKSQDHDCKRPRTDDQHRRHRSRSRDRDQRRRERRDRDRRRKTKKSRTPEIKLTPEERDQRTVLCMQLSARIRSHDLDQFFSSVGKVKDVRIISDNRTRRSKGIAYVEFTEIDSALLALGLSGQKLLGVPIIVQQTQAEKNRAAAAAVASKAQNNNLESATRLYIGSLHLNITENMLEDIFKPFGRIEQVQLLKDSDTGRSKGYGFITFADASDAKQAMEGMNGFELVGRPIKVGHVTRTDISQGCSIFDSEEVDRTGIDLGTTGRLQLMAKLAEGTGLELPAAAVNALKVNMNMNNGEGSLSVETQCFMLSNMFDHCRESGLDWDVEIRNDVIEECIKHGGVLHVFVDKASPQGNVYVKCVSISSAVATVNALHGRWFAGKVITATYIPVVHYHNLFPNVMMASEPLTASSLC